MVEMTVGTQQVYGLKIVIVDVVYKCIALGIVVGAAVDDDALEAIIANHIGILLKEIETEGFDVKLNGKSIAAHYQPCSYVEIPLRKWSKKDLVEVTMPYRQHLDFTPDKMEIDQRRTAYEPRWTAAIMEGPLVMAAQGISTWEDATLRDGQDLSGLRLLPDYAADENITHYFRIDARVEQSAAGGEASLKVLRSLMQMAKKRMDAQEAWNALVVKVPEHAPWAPYGYARMAEQYQKAVGLLANGDNGAELDKTSAALNAALNTMRPGNLAEPEELQPLAALMEKTQGTNWREMNSELRQALRYAQMVTKYVNDGSGTRDMIQRAVSQLEPLVK